jgi:hypothetical protein
MSYAPIRDSRRIDPRTGTRPNPYPADRIELPHRAQGKRRVGRYPNALSAGVFEDQTISDLHVDFNTKRGLLIAKAKVSTFK